MEKQPEKSYFQVRSSKLNDDLVIAVCTDISRIKKIEKTATKMKGIYFSSVAHELRTPLNSIIPIIRMLLSQLSSPNFDPSMDRHAEYLRIVLNSSLHLESVIEDALDMTRIENNKFTLQQSMFDIREACSEIAGIMKFPIEHKGLSLTLDIDSSVPAKVLSDCKRFKQILFNLLGNAIKFTFTGGITVRLHFQGGILTSVVEDTGVGI